MARLLPDPQTAYWILIIGLLLCYGVYKANHVALALEAYQGQTLTSDTWGAAK